MLTATAFGILWGNYITLGNILTPLFKDQFTSSQISIIGAIFVVTGIIGCYLMGLYLDKTQRQLTGIRFITVGMLLLFVTALFIIPVGMLALTCVFAFLAGALNVPILPSSYAFVSKLMPGMAPAVVNGFMMSCAYVYSLCVTLWATWLLEYGQIYCVGWFVLTILIATICVLCVKQKP